MTSNNAANLLSGYNPYVSETAFRSILNLVESISRETAVAHKIARQFESTFKLGLARLGFPHDRFQEHDGEISEDDAKAYVKENPRDRFYSSSPDHEEHKVCEEDWNAIKTFAKQKIAEFENSTPPVEIQNLHRLADLLEMSDREKQILSTLYAMKNDSFLGSLTATIFPGSNREIAPALVSLLRGEGDRVSLYSKILSVQGRLQSYGLINVSRQGQSDAYPKLDPMLLDKLCDDILSDDALVARVLGHPEKAELEIKDFNHLGHKLDHILQQIDTAIANGETGVNILLYGSAGTGKTELTKAIADHLNKKLYSVGENSEIDPDDLTLEERFTDFVMNSMGGGDGTTAQQRIAQLRRTHALLKGRDDCIVFLDEAEDLLMKGANSGDKPDPESKLELNRLFEKNPIVTIYAVNDADKFHESVKDRFDFSLYIEEFPTLVRAAMWERHLENHDIELPQEDIIELARQYSVMPRQIGKAIRAASRLEHDATPADIVDVIQMTLKASAQLKYGTSLAVLNGEALTDKFNANLVNTNDGPLISKAARLQSRLDQQKPTAIFLQGPKKAGGHEALRALAEKSVVNTMEVSAKMLMAENPMGDSPATKIKKAFAIAADRGRFLVVHDIEHIAQGNPEHDGAWRGDLSQLFLDCARAYPLPFAVTSQEADTSFAEVMTHTFTDHYEFAPLTAKQCVEAYNLYFKDKVDNMSESVTADEFEALDAELYVGDFKAVMLRLQRDDKAADKDSILKYLRKETTIANDPGSQLGFHTGP